MLSITVKMEIPYEYFESVLVGALEGGSNYWYWINDDNLPNYKKGEPLSTQIATELYNNPEYKLKIYDVESDLQPELLGTISQESLLKAFKDSPNELNDIINGDDDANTADILFQKAVMGEVVYG